MHRVRRSLVLALVVSLAWVSPASGIVLKGSLIKINNTSPAADANFGFAVTALGDVSGDGVADFAVGAPGSDRVDVFNGATRAKIRSIGDPENKPGNEFGFSVANVGDINGDGISDLAVGARGKNLFVPLPCLPPPDCIASPEQGRVFVFSGATGGLIRKLSPGGTDFLAFGYAVSGLGDVSGDGVPDIAVGAPTLTNNRFGQVYAFSGATGAVLWLVKEAPQELASFGTSLASTADHNGDGRRDLLVGAFFHDFDTGPGSTLVGRAYLLSGATGAEIRHHDNPLGAAGKVFGFSATALADQTGDGVEDYAISDPGASRVFLFNGATGAGAGTIATPGSATDNFGADLATSEDRDGDAKADLWVGAPGGGKVYLVKGSGAVLLTFTDPTAAGAPSLRGFGFALAATPNLGGDAGTDLLIGEPAEDDLSGAVYLALIAANIPPVADAGADATIECASPNGTDVILDGSGSSDADSDPLTYEWRNASNALVGSAASVTVALPPGSHTFTLTVSDGFESDSDTVTITIADTTDPTVSVALSPTTLWPPNHKMHTITATASATDVCSGALPVVLVSIASNEPDNGLGDGDTTGDIQGAAFGTADTTFSLRAERSGKGSGRVYTVTYGATDAAGNSSTTSATVSVPHSKGK